jgi:hypothetical protein
MDMAGLASVGAVGCGNDVDLGAIGIAVVVATTAGRDVPHRLNDQGSEHREGK